MMKKPILAILGCTLAALTIAVSCKHKPNVGPGDGIYGGFPDNVGKIFIDRCATAGCHNQASYTASGGLLLDSYEHLLDGGNNGASIIAYSPEYSPLMYFINNAANGNSDPISTPSMPESGTPLTKDEYNLIRDWVASGAPDRNGNIAFGSNADTRQKIYMTQQACDLLAVIDADRKVVMRYIKLGMTAQTESPHCVRVDHEGKYAYVSFTAGQYIQRINTTTDKIDLMAILPASPPSFPGNPQWNILHIAPKDGKEILLSDWRSPGRNVLLSANTLAKTAVYDADLQNPHGITSNYAFDTFYVTAQDGNTVYRITKTYDIKKISLDGPTGTTATATYTGSPNPHEIMMLPDYNRFVVTCENSHEIRIVDIRTREVKIIPVGKKPQEIAISTKNHLLYISCQDDKERQAGSIFSGSVYVFDYDNFNTKPTVIAGKMAQPHGLIVDDKNDVLYVASQNADGPAPHHASSCGGRNGYYQLFSSKPPFAPVNTKTYEVSQQPYSVDVRFK